MTVSGPSVSVITVCKNSAATIERTLESVVGCSYPGVQYVVVDGCSKDGTQAILARYRRHISKLISEPDLGISDALNKAIGLTDGEYHILVHADDVLLPGALECLAEAAVDSEAQVICGRAAVVNGARLVRLFVPEPAKLARKMSIPHMGALVRKQAWQAVGGYDLRRRIAMDHLFMLRILGRYGLAGFRTVDSVVARYSLGGLSDRHVMRGFREVRDNLLEEGVGRWSAQHAYVTLIVKARIARILGVG